MLDFTALEASFNGSRQRNLPVSAHFVDFHRLGKEEAERRSLERWAEAPSPGCS